MFATSKMTNLDMISVFRDGIDPVINRTPSCIAQHPDVHVRQEPHESQEQNEKYGMDLKPKKK
jgi:hypothetical protein